MRQQTDISLVDFMVLLTVVVTMAYFGTGVYLYVSN